MDSREDLRRFDAAATPGPARGAGHAAYADAHLGASPWARALVALGSLAGLGAVGMAALAAHALPARLAPAGMEAVRSAVQMQGWHALALLACGIWAARGGWPARAAGVLFALGMLLFCGAVYAWALAGVGGAALAPVGGVLLMAGWALLCLSALLPARQRPAIRS